MSGAAVPQYTYTRKKENDLNLGPTFEDFAVINSFLMLEDDQALAREIDDPTNYPSKFDDIVIRVPNTKQLYYEYICRQLKHKDTANNSDKNITWDDLLCNDKKNSFCCLLEYFKSYLNYRQGRNYNQIKELLITTNLGLLSNQPAVVTAGCTLSKPQVVNSLLACHQARGPQGNRHQPPASKVKHYITQDDINGYFDELLDRGIGNIPGIGKRFKFSTQGIQDVSNCLLTTTAVQQQHAAVLKEFLELLVFEVEQPKANDLKQINQSLLKILFFPFHWDRRSRETCCNRIKDQVL